MRNFLIVACAVLVPACAGIRFGSGNDTNGMPFYVGVPALKVSTGADCSQSAEIITLPAERRSIKFAPGLGSAKLSFKISNGMLTEVNSETSGAVADVEKLAGLAATIVPFAETRTSSGCVTNIQIFELDYDDGSTGSPKGPRIGSLLWSSSTPVRLPATAGALNAPAKPPAKPVPAPTETPPPDNTVIDLNVM